MVVCLLSYWMHLRYSIYSFFGALALNVNLCFPLFSFYSTTSFCLCGYFLFYHRCSLPTFRAYGRTVISSYHAMVFRRLDFASPYALGGNIDASRVVLLCFRDARVVIFCWPFFASWRTCFLTKIFVAHKPRLARHSRYYYTVTRSHIVGHLIHVESSCRFRVIGPVLAPQPIRRFCLMPIFRVRLHLSATPPPRSRTLF